MYILAKTGIGEMRANGGGILRKREGEFRESSKFLLGFLPLRRKVEAFISFSQLISIKLVAAKGMGDNV